MASSIQVNCLIVVFSAGAWAGPHMLHDIYLNFLNHRPGIDLVFIPSGIRLVLLMMGGVWAAFGVVLGSLMLAGLDVGFHKLTDVVVLALLSGFGTYAVLRFTQSVLGISPQLENLTAWHLPLISLCVAVGSSTIHNLAFASLGIEGWADFVDNTLAMIMGDFVGSLIVVASVLGALKLYRRLQA